MNIFNSYKHKMHNLLLYPTNSYNDTLNIKISPKFQILYRLLLLQTPEFYYLLIEYHCENWHNPTSMFVQSFVPFLWPVHCWLNQESILAHFFCLFLFPLIKLQLSPLYWLHRFVPFLWPVHTDKIKLLCKTPSKFTPWKIFTSSCKTT